MRWDNDVYIRKEKLRQVVEKIPDFAKVSDNTHYGNKPDTPLLLSVLFWLSIYLSLTFIYLSIYLSIYFTLAGKNINLACIDYFLKCHFST